MYTINIRKEPSVQSPNNITQTLPHVMTCDAISILGKDLGPEETSVNSPIFQAPAVLEGLGILAYLEEPEGLGFGVKIGNGFWDPGQTQV